MLLQKKILFLLISAVVFESQCWGKSDVLKDHAKVMITEKADKKSGIVKRAIMIGNKVCGKEGFVVRNNAATGSKREEIDMNALHRDLHPERAKDEVSQPTKTIEDKENAPAVVVSKLSKQVGWFERLNRCCIDHESCDKFVPAKDEMYGFKNEREYTVFDCTCDDAFAECLKYADSHTADAVGDLYFNVLKMPCINFAKGDNTSDTVDQGIMEKVDKIIEERLKEKAEKATNNEESEEKPTEVPSKEKESEEESNKEKSPDDENQIRSKFDSHQHDATERHAARFMKGTH